jgi:hypothetical protein
MRRQVAIIKLNELHSSRVEVPHWEIPILQRIHVNTIKLEGETECNLRVPDPAEEYMRLERRYGVDRESRVPHVVGVYPTVQDLADAMHDALEAHAKFDEADAKRHAESKDAPAQPGKVPESNAGARAAK